MKLKRKHTDDKEIERIIREENSFITHLFAISSFPANNQNEGKFFSRRSDNSNLFLMFTDESEFLEDTHHKPEDVQTKTNRAQTISELQERLQAMRTKKKSTYKEKLTKQKLKNRVKKIKKQDERHVKQKMLRAAKEVKKDLSSEEVSNTQDTTKPVFNSNDKIVFSKVDFADIGKKKKKKAVNDPKSLLNELQKQKEKLNTLQESGDTGKALEIKQKVAWKNAVAKAEGKKVKDDPELLKRSIKRQEQKKKASQKKWKVRQENVEKTKEERQKKRADNIAKRKKDKKLHKLKKAAKKGKIIPGF